MSLTARVIVGMVALAGGCFFYIPLVGLFVAPPIPTDGWGIIGIGILWLIVAVACFFPKTWPVTLRVIGAAVFIIFACGAVASLWNPELWRTVIGFWVIGRPFGSMAVFGRYPRWGIDAGAIERKAGDS